MDVMYHENWLTFSFMLKMSNIIVAQAKKLEKYYVNNMPKYIFSK
jgi:hypothetical protein